MSTPEDKLNFIDPAYETEIKQNRDDGMYLILLRALILKQAFPADDYKAYALEKIHRRGQPSQFPEIEKLDGELKVATSDVEILALAKQKGGVTLSPKAISAAKTAVDLGGVDTIDLISNN